MADLDLSQYDPAIQAAAQEWGQDPTMLKALILQESGGRAGATSGAGAKGLTQIMPATATGLGVTDPSDPTQQIFGAAKYLSQGQAAEGTPEGALLYYHGGPKWRQSYGPESQGYVPGVAAHYTALKASAQSGGGADAVPSDADFLKMAGPAAGASADGVPTMTVRPGAEPGVPSDADFLKATGAAAGPPPAAEPASMPANGEFGDLANQPWAQGAQPALGTVAPVAALAKTIGGAAVQGWQDTQPLLTQRAQDAVDATGPIGRYIINPLAHIAGAVPAAANALGAGTSAAIGAGAEAAGAPALGRDLNMLAQVAPMAHFGTGVPGIAAEAGPAAAAPRFVSEHFAPPAVPGGTTLDRLNQLIGHDNAEVAGQGPAVQPNRLAPAAMTQAELQADIMNPPGSQPAPRPGMGGPQPAGAMASTAAEAEMTPKEIAAYRATAEGSKLIEPQPVGQADRTPYVPGVNPNTVETEQTVQAAREAKKLNVQAPDASDFAKATADANNTARTQFFDSIAKSPVDISNAEAARADQLAKDYPAAFDGAKDANSQKVVDAIQDALTTNRGKQNTQLQSYIKPLLGRLMDEDGNLKITNPEELYGFREDLARMTSKASKANDPNLSHVSGELNDIIGVTDKAIEDAAPGYRNYMDNYAAASRGIDQMRVLQDHRNRLFDSASVMQPAKVQAMMRNIVDSRAAPGINPYKSIDGDQLEQLWNLRDDLRRSQSAKALGGTPGSDTAQNAWDLVKDAASSPAAGVAAHVGGFVAHGPVGAAVAGFGKNLLANTFSKRAANKANARAAEIYYPDRTKNPLNNRLAN